MTEISQPTILKWALSEGFYVLEVHWYLWWCGSNIKAMQMICIDLQFRGNSFIFFYVTCTRESWAPYCKIKSEFKQCHDQSKLLWALRRHQSPYFKLPQWYRLNYYVAMKQCLIIAMISPHSLDLAFFHILLRSVMTEAWWQITCLPRGLDSSSKLQILADYPKYD